MSAASKPTAPWARVCYGVDAGSGSAVRAERSGRGVSWKEIPLHGVTQAASADHAAIASGMPVGLAIAAWVAAPFPSARKAQRVFPTLLDIQLPFPLEDCLYGFSETVKLSAGAAPFPLADRAPRPGDENRSGTEVSRVASLAFAARTADVERCLAGLAETGIDPHVLDYEGVALWTQGLREHAALASDGTLRAVVFLRGEEGIMAIGRGAHFWSAHRIRTGDPAVVDRYLRAQLSQMGADAEERPSIEWLWAGKALAAGERGDGLRTVVQARWPGRSVTVVSPESFLARALATRALLSGPLRVNLRLGALAHTGAASRSQQVHMRAAAVLLVAGALLCGGAGWWEATVAARHSGLDSAFRDRLERIVGYPVRAKGANALLIAEREQAERASRRAPLAEAFQPSLLADLQEVLPALGQLGIRVQHLDLAFGTLLVRGDAPSVTAVHALRDAMAAIGYSVQTTIGDQGEDRTEFVLDATHEGQHE